MATGFIKQRLTAEQTMKIHNNGDWMANVDLNTLTDSGIYFVSSGLTNSPVAAAWGTLIVMYGQGNSLESQILVMQSSIYYRRRISESWLQISRQPVIETAAAESSGRTVANGSYANYQSITHSKSGYTCYCIGISEYRTTAGWYIHTKGISANTVSFDYVNNTGADVTANPQITWLCIPG